MKEFSPFRLDPVNQCLWRQEEDGQSEEIPLKPTAFAILRYLVDHVGRLVTTEELLDAVWPNIFVQPEVLKRHIFDIRRALDDEPKTPRFVQTLPRRGYQFVAPVRDATAAAASAAADAPAQIKLVGRERTLSELQRWLGKAVVGQSQVGFVVGEPGIGKTSLMDEFQRQVLGRHVGTGLPIRAARGQCAEGYAGKEAYYPVLEALGNLCRSPGGESLVQILAAQAPTWLAQFPSLIKREQRDILQREIPWATRDGMLREVVAALETFTSESPLLLVLEDLHWADHSTVDFISVIARVRRAVKLLLIGTYRPTNIAPSEHPLRAVKEDLLAHQLCHELALQPLGEAEIEAYFVQGSPESKLPKGFAGLVHRHSEGNPLFMVAIIDHLTDKGFVSRQHGDWSLNVPIDEIDLEVPESLGGMIEAQIERLSPAERTTLEAASVCGVLFAANVTAAATAIDDEQVEDLCDELSRRQHIIRRAGIHQLPNGKVSPSFEFLHALYREVFYHRQAPARRMRSHLRIGQRLEELYARNEIEVAAELAQHFEDASHWPGALKYLCLAADSAKRRYANDEATAILQHASGLLNKLGEPDRITYEIEILQRLGMF
jgi:predicted ATPase/DNA-binding winged helix-turn-helix (wHTH) protein